MVKTFPAALSPIKNSVTVALEAMEGLTPDALAALHSIADSEAWVDHHRTTLALCRLAAGLDMPAPDARDSQRALTDHVDAGDVSVMVTLSDPSSYEGGGTTFGGLPRVVHCGAGDALTFDAALTHRGEPNVAGERYMLV